MGERRHILGSWWLQLLLLMTISLSGWTAQGTPDNGLPSGAPVTCLGEAICSELPDEATLRSRALANEILEAVATLPEIEQRFFLEKRRNARGFAIFPNVQKGGVLGANIYGRGILSVRDADGSWTPPVLLVLQGQSVGPQVGAQSNTVLFVFHTVCSVKDFVAGHHHLNYVGTDCTIVHIDHPSPEFDEPTDITIHIFERGVVLGQSIDSYAVHIDEEANAAIYGVEVKPGCMIEAVRRGMQLPWMMRYMERLGRRDDEAHITYTGTDHPPAPQVGGSSPK